MKLYLIKIIYINDLCPIIRVVSGKSAEDATSHAWKLYPDAYNITCMGLAK